MRWASRFDARQRAWANRYVRRFAWRPIYDFDSREWVWLEFVHVRQYWSKILSCWIDFDRYDHQYESWLASDPISDSRVGQD